MSDVMQLEQQLKNHKSEVALRDLAHKLASYPEFKKLINQEYLVNEAARLVQLSVNINLDKQQREDALNMAQATGHFKAWLAVIDLKGNNAERAIESVENEIILARQEEDAE